MPQIIGSLGLVLDIVGVVLLFKFGLPEEVRRSGLRFLATEEEDEDEKRKAQHYDRMGRFGLVLLIAGFVFQLIGNLVQLPAVAALLV
jgi:hypothetical protein